MNKKRSLSPLKFGTLIPGLALILSLTGIAPAADKPRLVVLTDISPDKVEPDDMESIIRLLVHADLFEIEGLIHSTGWSASTAREDYYQLIHEAIDLYQKDLPNLLKRSGQKDHLHDSGTQQIGYWPGPDYLRERSMMGSKHRGQKFIGKDNRSPGSDFIIKLADEKDDRPLWISVWGGGNTLAQAIWQVQETRSKEELQAFLNKLRVYTITDQDGKQKSGNVIDWQESSHSWMRQQFEKDLFFIWDESAWKHQNGTGRKNWTHYATHIQGHGNLGKRYPKYKYGVEGDTPAFLHLIPNGLNDPESPNHVGWGGYFEFATCKDGTTKAYQNHRGSAAGTSSKYQSYFYPATFRNFAARMDWAKDGKGNKNPVAVIDDDAGLNILTKSPQQGSTLTLDASKSHDPDGDELTFKWWVLSEAGTYQGKIDLEQSNSSRVTLKVPSDSAGKSFHLICEITDNGTHNLSAYRRIIFTPSK
ncbi:MAG: nucleoside hydrolase-like domain-containing protein [Verrucomicrobiaceae bacterium]